MLSPVLTKLTSPENAGGVKTGSGRFIDLVTVDTDQQGELASRYGVRAVRSPWTHAEKEFTYYFFSLFLGQRVAYRVCFQRW